MDLISLSQKSPDFGSGVLKRYDIPPLGGGVQARWPRVRRVIQQAGPITPVVPLKGTGYLGTHEGEKKRK